MAGWVETSNTRLIDASTAHRVAEGWIYGLPELQAGQRELISEAKYVSNPAHWLVQTRILWKSKHQVQVLNGYSTGALAQVIE